MKILSYRETPKGTKILIAIRDAKLNPLEIKARAVEHIESLDDFKQLKATFKEHENLIEVYQKAGKPIDSPPIRTLIERLRNMDAELTKVRKQYEADNPVYLTPANAILVDDERAESIKGDIKKGEYIALVIDDDGKGFNHSVLTGASMGKKYRLPDTLEWLIIQHPDEQPPADALFTDPSEAELVKAYSKRIKGLGPDEREAEKANAIEGAENAFIRACIRADNLGDKDPEITKHAARKELEAAKKDIEALYKA